MHLLTVHNIALDKSADSNGLGSSTNQPPARAKSEVDENIHTIRPTRSPGGKNTPLSTPPAMSTIVEDYSDLGGEDEDMQIERKVASFKVCDFYFS